MHAALKQMCVLFRDLQCFAPSNEKLGESALVAVQGSALWYLHSLALLDAEPAWDVPVALVSFGDLPFIRLSCVDLS